MRCTAIWMMHRSDRTYHALAAARALLACAILFGLHTTASAVPFTVPANDPVGIATGITASAGQIFSITATGLVNLAINNGPYITDPNGTIVTAPPVGSGAYNFFRDAAAPLGVPPAVGDKKFIDLNSSGGNTGEALDGAAFGALLAYWSTDPSHPVLVGASGLVKAPANGAGLSLVVNDLFGHGDNSGAYTAIVAAVPEPSTWLLLVTGLVVLCGYGWRQKQSVA